MTHNPSCVFSKLGNRCARSGFTFPAHIPLQVFQPAAIKRQESQFVSHLLSPERAAPLECGGSDAALKSAPKPDKPFVNVERSKTAPLPPHSKCLGWRS